MKLGTSHIVAVIVVLAVVLAAVYVSYGGTSKLPEEVYPDKIDYTSKCEVPEGEMSCGETTTVVIKQSLSRAEQGGGVPGMEIELLSANARVTGNVATLEMRAHSTNCTISSSTLAEGSRVRVPHPIVGEYLVLLTKVVPTAGTESVTLEVTRSCYN